MIAESNERFARLARAVANSRDKRAFTELFDHFAPRLKSYLQRLGMDSAQAEELAQEVMVVLWHKASLFDPAKSSLATWIFRVARNRRIDALRWAKGRELDGADPALRPTAPEPPDETIDADHRDERVRRAMADLPPEQLEMVRMAFFLGFSHSRIAEETGLPLGTVKSRIRLAFGRLRKALQADPAVDVE